MEFRNTGNQILKNLISALGFILITFLLLTTTTVLFQVIAVAAIVGGAIWLVHKFINFIKSKINIEAITKHKSNKKLVVEIVTDPEIQNSFIHKNIIDVEYDEVNP